MSQIKLTADSGGGTTSLKAPSSTTSNADVVLKLPVADGSSGQVLKTDGSGQLSFTSNAGTTINNNADNRVITGSGTASTLNGESNVIIDSNGHLGVGGAPDFEFQVTDSSGAAVIRARDGANAVTTDLISDSTGGHIRTVTNHSLRFSTNQSERLRIDTSGHVGIGDTSPAELLTLRDSTPRIRLEDSDTTNAACQFVGDNANVLIQADTAGVVNDSNISFAVDGGERMRIDSSGKVGIGTTSPVTAMHIANADDPVTITLQNTDSNTPTGSGGEILFKGTKTNGDPIFFGGIAGKRRNQSSDVTGYLAFLRQDGDGSNNAIEAGRIDHGGHVYFCGMTGLTAGSSIKGIAIENSTNNGRINIHANSSAGNALGIGFYNNGSAVGTIYYSSSATTYNTSSDYRLKENVTAISDGITRLKTLKPSRFNFKVDKDKTVDGFLAHEVTAVPEAITGTKDEVDKDKKPVYQGIDQSKLVPLLTAALQEAVGKIETLETKVAALEGA